MIGHHIQAIVLAAGKSNRFNVGRTKILEKICGREMILYPAKLLESMNILSTYVVGYQKEAVQATLSNNLDSDPKFVHQKEQLGTGHAVMCTQETWEKDHLLILNGDMPLINREIIQQLFEKHVNSQAVMSFVTAHFEEPNAYGRVVYQDGKVKIIEAKDFVGNLNESCWINAGIYLIKKYFLKEYISKLNTNNKAQEFYITDLVGIASDNNYHVETLPVAYDSIRGINTLKELWEVEHIKRSELIEYWMSKGVRFSKAHTVHIDLDVTIGSGTVIGQAVQLLGKTIIGSNSIVEPFTVLQDATIGNNVTIYSHSVLKESSIANDSKIGPFAYVHSKSKVGEFATVGNFCELSCSIIGNRTQTQHMVYLGNSEIGADVYIGAGTSTNDFDGMLYQKTIIKDKVKLRGNNSIIAPVTVNASEDIEVGCMIMSEEKYNENMSSSCGNGCLTLRERQNSLPATKIFQFKTKKSGAI